MERVHKPNFKWAGGMIRKVCVPRGYNTEDAVLDGELILMSEPLFFGFYLQYLRRRRENARPLKYTNSDYNLSSQ